MAKVKEKKVKPTRVKKEKVRKEKTPGRGGAALAVTAFLLPLTLGACGPLVPQLFTPAPDEQKVFDAVFWVDAQEYTSLPQECLWFYACQMVKWEVDNGGFAQFYWNVDMPETMGRLAADGFEEIGVPKLAAMMREANAIFEGVQGELAKYKIDSRNVHNYIAWAEPRYWDAIEPAFVDEYERCDLQSLLLAYLDKHAAAFGETPNS